MDFLESSSGQVKIRVIRDSGSKILYGSLWLVNSLSGQAAVVIQFLQTIGGFERGGGQLDYLLITSIAR